MRALCQSGLLVSEKRGPSGSVVKREWRMGAMALQVYRLALVRLAVPRPVVLYERLTVGASLVRVALVWEAQRPGD